MTIAVRWEDRAHRDGRNHMAVYNMHHDKFIEVNQQSIFKN